MNSRPISIQLSTWIYNTLYNQYVQKDAAALRWIHYIIV